jgi:hypothetical protein
MLMLRLFFPLTAVAILSSCWRQSTADPSPAELFRLRAECANQARSFEAAWRGQYDYGGFQTFSNHYNAKDGRCYVLVEALNSSGSHDILYDATEGIGGKRLVWRDVLKAKKWPENFSNSENDDDKARRKIEELTEQNLKGR